MFPRLTPTQSRALWLGILATTPELPPGQIWTARRFLLTVLGIGVATYLTLLYFLGAFE